MTNRRPDWHAERNPDALLTAVVDTRGYARRLRLFGCACARQVWHLLPTDARSAVQVSERFADGKATATDLRAAAVRLPEVAITAPRMAITAAGYTSVMPEPELFYSPWRAARYAARALATEAVGPAPRQVPESWHDAWNQAYDDARATQAGFVRGLFPPPDFTPRLEPDWLTTTVDAIARQMDQTGDFSAVPILADALQEAGCDSDPVLECCRAPGNVHVRGNWVVDLVLGRQ